MGGKKKKRQETTSAALSSSSAALSSSSSLRSSSYRRDSGSPATSTTNVGCMSGIFHLMSKYHTRRKFLTFGKKQERNAVVQASTSPPPTKSEDTVKCQQNEQSSSAGRLSLDQTPRSPAIPAEIRRSSTDSSVSSPRVVARLMGLEDFPARSPVPATVVSPAAEKRRKLLGALEKCDEDLQALKKIIEAVRATQTPPRVAEMKRREEVEDVESEVGSDGPSPVSVLDHRHLSSGYYHRTTNEQIMQQQKPKQQKPQQMTRKKPGDHEDKAINFLNKTSLPSITPQLPLHLPARTTHHQQVLNTAATTTAAAGEPWSTAMKESVYEVCKDIERGQIQEVGRIGLILQDIIFRELIDEIIKEFGSSLHKRSTSNFKLPFEACKRQLSF